MNRYNRYATGGWELIVPALKEVSFWSKEKINSIWFWNKHYSFSHNTRGPTAAWSPAAAYGR